MMAKAPTTTANRINATPMVTPLKKEVEGGWTTFHVNPPGSKALAVNWIAVFQSLVTTPFAVAQRIPPSQIAEV
jgi:hypothetical protein